MRNLLSLCSEFLAEGKSVVMAAVLETKGSTPRKAGAVMLVLPDGTIRGTVGGGSLEKKVVEEAMKLLAGGGEHSRRISFSMRGALKEGGMVCGGEALVHLELLTPDTKSDTA